MASTPKIPLEGTGWSKEQQARRPSPKMSATPLEKKGPRDLYREPAPLKRDIEIETPGRVEIEGPEGNEQIHVDAKTGAAWREKDGIVVVDFAGGRNLRDERREEGPGNFDDNLAERGDIDLPTIASRTLEGIDADKEARAEWEEMGIRGAEMLGVKWEEPSSEVSPDGFLSKINHPLLLRAGLQMWGNSRAELLPASGPVKVEDDLPAIERPQSQAPLQAGQQPPGSMPQSQKKNPNRSDLADALQKDMNHYLTDVDEEYYPDTSHMLLVRAFKGSQFKKVCFDPLERRPVSRWIRGENLIISNDANSLAKAGRVTEYSRVRQATVKRLQRVRWWRDVALVEPAPEASTIEIATGQLEGVQAIPRLPADFLHHIYECYCELDDGPLAKDENGKRPGFPLPYVVTIDKDSQQILAIRRNWKKGDDNYRARTRYVHYGMVPGFGFYHWGFFHILGQCQRTATAMSREFIDAEMFASFPGGVIRKSPGTSRNDKTLIRPAPGHYVVVDTGTDPIGDAIKEWPYKGASPGLVEGIKYFDAAAKELSGTVELPVGEGRVGDVPVGTIMAYIEAIQKVPSAVHKDDHIAQAKEFRMLKALLEETPECLEPHDGGDRQWTAEMLRDQKLSPKADPNTPSAAHRLMKATAQVQMAAMPNFIQITDQRKVMKRAYQVLDIEDGDDYVVPEPPPGAQPPPDPKVIAEQLKAQLGQAKLASEAQKTQQKGVEQQRQAAEALAENEQREKDRQSEEQIEQARLQIERMRMDREHARETRETALEHHRGILEEVGEHVRHLQTLSHERGMHGVEQANERAMHADDVENQRAQTRQQGILGAMKNQGSDNE